MALDRSLPNRYTSEKEHKSKSSRPPRGAITKKRNGMFRVVLTVDGVRCNLGLFKERSHAEKAYWEAMRGME